MKPTASCLRRRLGLSWTRAPQCRVPTRTATQRNRTCARRRPEPLPPFAPERPFGAEDESPVPPVARPAGLAFDNGLGGFSADGREYVIYLEPGQQTPAPWVNVVANPEFGFLVSESGSGDTWALNSGENRLTPWSNDPVTDRPGEALYLRDEETAEVWSPTPQPCGAAGSLPGAAWRRLYDFRAQQPRVASTAAPVRAA